MRSCDDVGLGSNGDLAGVGGILWCRSTVIFQTFNVQRSSAIGGMDRFVRKESRGNSC